MFKVPLLPSRSEKYLYDPKASHNQFYHNVYCKIPEEIFRPLYCEGNGRPGASVRLLCAMRVYKEGGGYSDQEMFEALRFDILVRKSMGLMKQKIFALSRCLWVNHVRLALFELRMTA